MKIPRPPEATAPPAARRSRTRNEDLVWVCGRPALVLYPVVDPRVTQSDEGSHRGRRLRDLTGTVVILFGTVSHRRIDIAGDISVKLAVQAAYRRAPNSERSVNTVRRNVIAHQQHAPPAQVSVDGQGAGHNEHSASR